MFFFPLKKQNKMLVLIVMLKMGSIDCLITLSNNNDLGLNLKKDQNQKTLISLIH